MQFNDMIVEAFDPAIERTADKQRRGRFKVRVRQSPAGSMPLEQALTVEYDDKALQTQLGQLEIRALQGDALVAFGRMLGQLLLPSDPQSGHGVRDLFARSMARLEPDQGLRLKLQLPAVLAQLPWEYLYLDRAGGGGGMDGFLALDRRVAIVRHEDLPAPPHPPLAPAETKMVVALASAPGFTPLDLAKERADLMQTLQSMPNITPVYLDNATLPELQSAITGSSVFHFAGHGVFAQQMSDQPGVYTGAGQIALDDQRVEATDLGILLRGAGIRLAVLGGCETGRRDGVSVWSGTAPALIKAEIPAVVANQFKVLDTCAIAFSQQFYQALLVGGLSIEQAMSAGRIAAYLADRKGRDWGAPVLYMRADDGRLFGGVTDEKLRRKAAQEAEQLITMEINTGGGAYIVGNIDTRGGDFAGRDIIHQYAETVYDVRGLLNPYLGLRAFTYAEKESYGGRKDPITAAVRSITAPGEQRTLLFITGASGSGKSSLAQAGVIPGLEAYYNQRHQTVSSAVFRPARQPLASLADALLQLGLPAAGPFEAAAPFLIDTPSSDIAPAVAERTPQISVLVIDQFEELFSQSDSVQRDSFFAILEQLPRFENLRAHIIATLRSDYLPELFEHTALYECAKQGIDLRAMNESELKEAIQSPLQANYPQSDKRFEDTLLNKLAHDAAEDATYLPLLQVTLEDLWREGSLKLGVYDTLTDAIQKRAEQVYAYTNNTSGQTTPRSAADQATIMQIFLDLVEVSLDDNQRRDVRHSRTIDELRHDSIDRDRLIEELVAARMLSKRLEIRDSDQVEMVDIVHETLIKNWGRLQQQIADQREALQRGARFEQALREWLVHKRDDAYLLNGIRLAEAEELDRQGNIVLRIEGAQELLKRSITAREAERQREVERAHALAEEQRLRAEEQRAASQRLRRRAQYLAIALLVAISASVLAILFNMQAQSNAVAAQDNATLANNNAATAVAEGQRANNQAATAVAEGQRANNNAATAVAEQQRANAEATTAGSQRLAFASQGQRDAPETGLLLAYEGVMRDRNPLTEQALRDALSRSSWRPIVLGGHKAGINDAVFSPDGQRMLTASDDGTARVWDLNGNQIGTLTGHTDGVLSAAFSRDGQRIATASKDATAQIWDLKGSHLATLTGHKKQVNSVDFSPDGQRIVTASDDGTARVWDLNGNQIVTLEGHKAEVVSAVFSPNGKYIVTASFDNTAGVWDAVSGRLLHTLEHHEYVVQGATFSPDGERIVTASEDYTARVWDLDGNLLATLEDNADILYSATFSLDGQRIVTASRDGIARVLKIDGTLVARLQGHTSGVLSAEFSADGQHVVTASQDGTARVWNANDGTPLAVLQGHTKEVVAASFSADGQYILTGSQDGTARLWDASGTPLLPTLRHNDQVLSANFSPDGKQVVTGSFDGTVRVWDATGKLLTTFDAYEKDESSPEFTPEGERDINTAAFSPDGQRIITASFNGKAQVWDLHGTLLATLEGHTDSVSSAAFSPDGQHIVTSSDDDTARIWTADGKLLHTLDHVADVQSAAFSADGQRIVTVSEKVARVWSIEGQPIHTFEVPDVVNEAAFNPDGTLLVLALGDGTAQVWRADGSGTAPLQILRGHSDLLRRASFSPDGMFILTGSYDQTARIWRTADGTLVTTQRANDQVLDTDYSPDGQHILVAVRDGTARIYPIDVDDMLAAMVCQVGRGLTDDERTRFGVDEARFVFADGRCSPSNTP